MAKRLKVKVECLECGETFATSNNLPECPKCGGSDVEPTEIMVALRAYERQALDGISRANAAR